MVARKTRTGYWCAVFPASPHGVLVRGLSHLPSPGRSQGGEGGQLTIFNNPNTYLLPPQRSLNAINCPKCQRNVPFIKKTFIIFYHYSGPPTLRTFPVTFFEDQCFAPHIQKSSVGKATLFYESQVSYFKTRRLWTGPP